MEFMCKKCLQGQIRILIIPQPDRLSIKMKNTVL